MTEWEPATEAEVAMRDALRANDQELYFRTPVPHRSAAAGLRADAARPAPVGWGTWTTGGRTHVLAFTSAAALRACLGDTRRPPAASRYADLAAGWPNHEWWLAVNPGLPIEGYLPAWFVAQLSRGDVRLPGRTMGARARLERVETLARRPAAGRDTAPAAAGPPRGTSPRAGRRSRRPPARPPPAPGPADRRAVSPADPRPAGGPPRRSPEPLPRRPARPRPPPPAPDGGPAAGQRPPDRRRDPAPGTGARARLRRPLARRRPPRPTEPAPSAGLAGGERPAGDAGQRPPHGVPEPLTVPPADRRPGPGSRPEREDPSLDSGGGPATRSGSAAAVPAPPSGRPARRRAATRAFPMAIRTPPGPRQTTRRPRPVPRRYAHRPR